MAGTDVRCSVEIELAGPTQPYVEVGGVEIDQFAVEQKPFLVFLGLALPRSVSRVRVVSVYDLNDPYWENVSRTRHILANALVPRLGPDAKRMIPRAKRGSRATRLAIDGPFAIDPGIVAYEPPWNRSVVYAYRTARNGLRGPLPNAEMIARITRTGEAGFRTRLQRALDEERALCKALASVGYVWQPDADFVKDLTAARRLFQ